MACRNWGYGGSGPTWAFALASGNNPQWSFGGTGAATYVMAQSVTSGILGQWNHYAFTRDASNVVRIFVNGVLGVSRTDSQGMTSSSGAVYLGVSTNLASGYANGYMAGARLVVGSPIYTSNFIPPAAPVTATANTTLLLGANPAIADFSMQNNLETFGDAKLSTAVKKYNTASLYFDGTGDYISAPASPQSNFGSGDLTIESWVYAISWPAYAYLAGQTSSADYAPVLAEFISGKPSWQATTASGSWTFQSSGSAPTLLTNTWYHVAWVRYGNEWSIYVNGTKYIVAASTSLTVYTSTTPMAIGSNNAGTAGSYSFNGYIDDFRITKGLARYTANFIPPTSALLTI
jgi:uncharacterized protein YacL (UPF0231 family)